MDGTVTLISCICLILFSSLGWAYLSGEYKKKTPIRLSKQSKMTYQANPVAYNLWHAFSCLILVAGTLVVALELFINWYMTTQ